jgi:hypothetical protein
MSSSSDAESEKQLAISKYIEECEPSSTVDLSFYPVSDSDMQIIVEKAILHKQSTALYLYNSQNTLTEKGTDILFNALHNNTVNFYFSNNFIPHK